MDATRRYKNGRAHGAVTKLPVPRGRAPLCRCGCGNRVSASTVTFITGHKPRASYKWTIWRSVVVDLQTGCWLWAKSLYPNGYAGVYTPDSGINRRLAHRVSYETFVGPIPDGLELDHLCKVRRCVNPEHLDPVTRTENLRRAGPPIAAVAARQAKTHCPQGHERNAKNTGTDKKGKHFCRVCQRRTSLDYYYRKKQSS